MALRYDSRRARQLLRAGTGRSGAAFREGQEDVIRRVVEGSGRLLLMQRTGWNKSFIHFIAVKPLREGGAGPDFSSPRCSRSTPPNEWACAPGIASDNQGDQGAAEAALRRGDADILPMRAG